MANLLPSMVGPDHNWAEVLGVLDIPVHVSLFPGDCVQIQIGEHNRIITRGKDGEYQMVEVGPTSREVNEGNV